jgi:hypothetical protein
MSLPEHVHRVSHDPLHQTQAGREASAAAHQITAAYWVGGHRFCDCSCGGTAELLFSRRSVP